jgi:hypothetical protein
MQMVAKYAQARRAYPKINVGVLAVHLFVFVQSSIQVGLFFDPTYYQVIPFPFDWVHHAYIFVFPVLVGFMLIPSYYPTKPKDLFYIQCAFMGVMSIYAMWQIPGKDLIWYSCMMNILFFVIGLKKTQAPLHYRYFVRYFFLENAWIALFYFTNTWAFAIGLVCQLVSRFYLFQLMGLYWAETVISGLQDSLKGIDERRTVAK